MMKDKYRVLIRSTWAVLIAYCLIKVLFGTCFDLVSESENFIAISTYIDNHLILKKITACCATLLSGYFVICAMLKQKYLKWYQLLIFVPLTIIKSISQWDIKLPGYILDIVILIILPMVTYKGITKERILRPILGSVLFISFQVLSMFLSSIALFKIDTLTTLTAILYNLEIYFMIALYYLYSTKEV